MTARLVLLATLLALSACTAVQRRGTEKAVAMTLISDEQERLLGFQVHEDLKKKDTKFLNNQKVEQYVENLARKLIPQANQERTLNWMWFVIDDKETGNAFATPGGRIYVYTGLLLAAESEAEVIGILGHELGHVVGRHSARQLVGAYGLETVAKMALGEDAGDVAKVTAGLLGQGALMAYGRDMELEADEHGVRYASASGYDPRGINSFFTKLQAKYGDQPKVLTWLSTHPSNAERINLVSEYITRNNLTGTDLGVDRLREIQKELGAK